MLNQTSAAASATKPMRSASGHRKAWPRALGGAEDDDGGPQENSEIKVERVVEALQGGRKPDFIQIADELDEVPWECAGGLAEPRSSRRARGGLGQAARDFFR